MADTTYTPVAFNEGAPLDPSLLMKLQDNVKVAYQTSMSLSNSTGETVYNVTSDCGREKIEGFKGNKDVRKTVTVPGFTDKAIVVATVSSTTDPKEQVTIQITNVLKGSFDMIVRSSNASRNILYVNWHISERQ